MSGDGYQQGKNGECDERRDDDDDKQNSVPPSQNRSRRPHTARHRRTTPSSSEGAVGGDGFHSRCLSEQQKLVGSQAQYLLETFITERVRRDNLPSQQVAIVNDAVSQTSQNCQSGGSSQTSQNSNDLSDVSLALRDIGDQLAQDYDLNRLIDMVVVQSPRDIFLKVCKQLFADGQFNWGRVVAVFYFAYRLIIKAVSVTMEKGVPWIKEIISWSMDFFYDYVIWWIVQRGGWGMIKEYFGPSTATMATLGVGTVLTLLYVWWKNQ